MKIKVNRIHLISIIYSAIILAFIIMTGSVYLSGSAKTGELTLSNTDFSTGWTAAFSDDTIALHSLSGLPDGKTALYNTLPERLEPSYYLNLESCDVFFSVAIGGEEVYSYYPEKNITGIGYGMAFHSISLYDVKGSDDITLTVEPAFPGDSYCRFENVSIMPGHLYYDNLVRQNVLGFGISLLIAFFGIAIIFLQIGLRNDKQLSLYSLGFSVVLIGLWSALQSAQPYLIWGHSAALRFFSYLLLPLALYPFTAYLVSSTAQKKQLYKTISFYSSAIPIVLTIALRYALDMDYHDLYFFGLSYLIHLILIAYILYEDTGYRRRNHDISASGKYSLLGVSVFVIFIALEMITYYFVPYKHYYHNGFFMRLGLVIMIIIILAQIMHQFGQEQLNVDSNRFINEFLHYSLSARSPEQIIGQMLTYLGTETNAERVYIFEEDKNGFFKNTYEWCARDVLPAKNVQQKIPFTNLLDIWFEAFGVLNYVIIENINDYRSINRPMADLAELLGVETLVSGPLIIDGDYIGFFGIDNPSRAKIPNISHAVTLCAFFMAVMLRQRNNERLLRHYSYRDQMTGTMNRRALEEYVQKELPETPCIGVMMCDINGLKRINDQQGHEAGDAMIRDVANCLSEVFGSDNVYRMGGDEFLAIAETSSEAVFDNRVHTLRLLIQATGRSASIGVSFGNANVIGFEEMQKTADTQMYADKRSYYKKHPTMRRRAGD